MFRNNVLAFKSLPVENKLRKRTDCCCTIISSLLAIVLLVLSLVLFRKANFYEVNYPTDSNGKTCYFDQPNAPYLYFSNPKNLSQARYCLQQCPRIPEGVMCPGCPKTPTNYTTIKTINRLGAFCLPQDNLVAQQIWKSPELAIKYSILQSIDTILLSLVFGLCIGIAYFICMLCWVKPMIRVAFLGAFLGLVAVGLIIIVFKVHIFSPGVANILIAVMLIAMGLTSLLFMLCSSQIKLAKIFLTHSNSFIKSAPSTLVYIPVFLTLTAGLLVLTIWQYIAFGTLHQTISRPTQIYRTSEQNYVLQILNILQFIWGLQFLRDAYCYLVSGGVVQWYFRNQQDGYRGRIWGTLGRFVGSNWGSVVGGAFLQAFLGPFDIFSQLFRCNQKGSCSKCATFYKSICFCEHLFQIIRSDTYTYINLTGIAYCNAARQCQALCEYSNPFRSARSSLDLFRTASHILTITLVTIICYFLLQAKGVEYINWFIIFTIVVGAYCLLTYFIDTHINAAQALMVCYLVQVNCQGDDLQVCPVGLRLDMRNYNYHQFL